VRFKHREVEHTQEADLEDMGVSCVGVAACSACYFFATVTAIDALGSVQA